VSVSAINLAEVIDVMTRIYHRTPAETLDALALLESGGLRFASVDSKIGLEAGTLHAQHYDRRTSALSMADCVALATARVLKEPLVTSDPALAAAARATDVVVIPLPDRRGRRPA
jgi:predicted nucleic acid-binding protein